MRTGLAWSTAISSRKNVFLLESGVVKLLDFGLARVAGGRA